MNNEKSLLELIEKGGIVKHIPGTGAKEALANLVGALNLPQSLDKDALLKAILERESLMPTSIGNGVAVPHPRNPLLTEASEEFVVIGFLENPVEWQALDNVPARTLILIVSSSAKSHLHTLSRVHFFCQHEKFLKLIQNHASKDEILEAIALIEKEWK